VVPSLKPKRWQDSASETVQVVLPNDSNPLGFILGGTVMHLIDITGAIACHRHTNMLALTAGVDSLDFIHPIKVGDLIILKSRVTCVFNTSLEVEVEVFSEEIQTGERKLTSKAYLTFVSLDKNGKPARVPPLVVETPEDAELCRQAQVRRLDRLKRRAGDSATVRPPSPKPQAPSP
jgi:acyl-CoA hydrolase